MLTTVNSAAVCAKGDAMHDVEFVVGERVSALLNHCGAREGLTLLLTVGNYAPLPFACTVSCCRSLGRGSSPTRM